MKYYVFCLALVCIAEFILHSVIPGFSDALLLNSDVVMQQPWRLLTSVFLHGSIGHLFYNLFALVLFGFMLESIVGSKRLLLFFAATIK